MAFTELLKNTIKYIDNIQRQDISQMNKENTVYIHNGLLLSHKEAWNSVICNEKDRTGGHYFKQTEPHIQRQMSHMLFHMEAKKKKS